MSRYRKVFLACFLSLCICLTSIVAVQHSTPTYPGMKRISAHTIHGNTASGDHSFELTDLKKDQLIVLIADPKRSISSSWIRHTSVETFIIEAIPFNKGIMEFEIPENGDYNFQLNCENEEVHVSVSIWDKTE